MREVEASMNQDSIIEVKNLKKIYRIRKKQDGVLKNVFLNKYKNKVAVDDISFSINKGEIVGFIGPNGAGKSTTIKILTGILTVSDGKVMVFGDDPYKNRKKNSYKVGAVFGQRSQLWWDLPVKDTFSLLKKLYRIPDKIYDRNLSVFKKYIDLDEIWDQPVRQLSLGQRMRTEIAASIIHNPEILYLDEPTIGLDIVAKRKIRSFIQEMNKEFNTTVILTSHDIKDIEELCNRIIIINKGKLVANQSIDEIKDRFNDVTMVDVTFVKQINKIDLGLDGIEKECHDKDDLHKWSFKLQNGILSIASFLKELINHYDIQKIEVHEKSIEDIISDIYEYGI